MNVTTTRAQNLAARTSILHGRGYANALAANSDLELALIDRFQAQADIWVKLRDRPNDDSDDEALLLCETTSGVWLGWVPGFGQITLQPGAFYRRM
jgi:hypothetical protein